MEKGIQNPSKDPFDMTLKDLPLDEIIRQLEDLRSNGYSNYKVRIVHSNGHQSCVGKILAGGTKDNGIIALFPVPEDIEILNGLTHVMSALVCEKAAKGQDCNKCVEMTICPHMKRFNENYKFLHEAFSGESEDSGESS